jgi:peptide/nickel transport system permease protein
MATVATDATLLETPAEEKVEDVKVFVATPRQLVWWRFRKHKVAVVSTGIVALFYIVAIFCEFIAPDVPDTFDSAHKYVAPQPISFFDQHGSFHLVPGVHGLTLHRDPVTLRPTYTADSSLWSQIHLLPVGAPYKF